MEMNLARELEEANMMIEEQYASMQEEVEMKTKKLNKVLQRYQQAKTEIKDLQVGAYPWPRPRSCMHTHTHTHAHAHTTHTTHTSTSCLCITPPPPSAHPHAPVSPASPVVCVLVSCMVMFVCMCPACVHEPVGALGRSLRRVCASRRSSSKSVPSSWTPFESYKRT
jgi:hypothetical protein